MHLYRVGTPSIGEVWPRRFDYGRSSGGLGTGVYAFRDREAAEQNIERSSPDKQLIVLRNALQNPVQPESLDGTEELVRLSRYMALLAAEVRNGENTFADAVRNADSLRASFGGIGRETGFGEGSSLSVRAQRVLLDVPELGGKYEYETEPFLRDFIQATKTAEQARSGLSDPTSVQPINYLLYPEFDGVAPRDGAGGNTGKHGCVIFKERVDDCVGRETESFESIAPGVLNACWSGSSSSPSPSSETFYRVSVSVDGGGKQSLYAPVTTEKGTVVEVAEEAYKAQRGMGNAPSDFGERLEYLENILLLPPPTDDDGEVIDLRDHRFYFTEGGFGEYIGSEWRLEEVLDGAGSRSGPYRSVEVFVEATANPGEIVYRDEYQIAVPE